MAKRLGGVLLGFGVNTAGEFCISYNVRLGEMCARDIPTLTQPRAKLSWCMFERKCTHGRSRSMVICSTILIISIN
jgi:hypothetical protein